MATGPKKMWNWDITYLHTNVRGIWLYFYLVIVVWGGMVVAWNVAEREDTAIAADMVSRAYICERISKVRRQPLILDDDNGNAMRAATLESRVKLVISNAYNSLTNANRLMLVGSFWQHCRVHVARNLLQTVPKAHQETVADAPQSVFAQQRKVAALEQWDQVSAILAAKFPRLAELMAKARQAVLPFRHFQSQHWSKNWNTNMLERVNNEIKHRTEVVGIFPNDAVIGGLVGAVLLVQHER